MSLAGLQGILDQSAMHASRLTREIMGEAASAEAVAALINQSPGFTVATVSPAGVPHAAVVVAVCEDGQILFTSTPGSVLDRNLRSSDLLAVTCAVEDATLMGQGRGIRLGAYLERPDLHPRFGNSLAGYTGLIYEFRPTRIFASVGSTDGDLS